MNVSRGTVGIPLRKFQSEKDQELIPVRQGDKRGGGVQWLLVQTTRPLDPACTVETTQTNTSPNPVDQEAAMPLGLGSHGMRCVREPVKLTSDALCVASLSMCVNQGAQRHRIARLGRLSKQPTILETQT